MPADREGTDDVSQPDSGPTFEARLEQLDRLVRTMESGELGLTESIAAYEQGVGLLRRLHEELSEIEQRVTTLVRLDADGNAVFEPAAGSPAAAGQLAAAAGDPASSSRSRRKRPAGTKNRARLPGMDEPGETS